MASLALYPKSEQEPYKILRNYWSAVAETFPKAWGLPPRQESFDSWGRHRINGVSDGCVVGRLR